MRRYVMILSALLLLFIGLPESKVSAAIADGTHSLNFQVNKPDNSSASMANDYFIKPAKLIVSNGSMKVQMTIKNSSWVTEFNPPGGATVISSNPSADTRVVQFSISSLNTIKVAMKIDIDDIDYHHSYTVDFVFDGSSLPEKQEQQATPPASSNNSSTSAAPSKPAATDKPSSTSNSSGEVSSKPTKEQNATSSNTTESVAPTTELGESSTDEEQVTTASEEENPETSDSLPLLAIIIFAAAFVVLLGSRKKQTV